MTGGEVIRFVRKCRGYSQRELSYRYGIAYNTLSNYERGLTEPSFMTVVEIVRWMGYDIGEAYRLAKQMFETDNQRGKSRAA